MASFEQASNLSKPQQGKPYKLYQHTSTLKNILCSSEEAWTYFVVHSSFRRTPIAAVSWPSWLPSPVAAVFIAFLPGMVLGLHHLSSLQADTDLWQAIYMEWESCHYKTSIVTWDSENMGLRKDGSWAVLILSSKFRALGAVNSCFSALATASLVSRDPLRSTGIQECIWSLTHTSKKLACNNGFTRSTSCWVKSGYKQMQRQVKAEEIGTDLYYTRG